ncbi:MAG: hypothetical protein WCK36_00800 [Candidatus Firestonebacteria bacterium]
MKRYLISLAAIILLFQGFLAAELSDKAKEAIEKAKLAKEADAKKRQEFKAKTANSNETSDNIPGKIVFRGNVVRSYIKGKGIPAIEIKFKDDKLIEVTLKVFIKDGKPITMNNLYSGMEVAIVNDLTAPSNWVGGQRADVIPCTITPTTKIYCGNDAGNLGKYYSIPKGK